MRRIEALIPYSHDHQHALANAHRLRGAAADAGADELAQVVEQTLAFAAQKLAEHLHHEESILLPQLAALGVVTDDQVDRIAREHLALRTLHVRLAEQPGDRALAATFAAALHDHVRWEERELFQSWQERLTAEQREHIDALTEAPTPGASQVSCQAPVAPGTTGLALGELNATCVTLAPGATQGGSADRDVALVCIAGSGTLELTSTNDADGGSAAELAPGSTHLLAAHAARVVTAADAGLTLVTVHRRRSPMHLAAPST
ncbi:MAG: hemerythrin domain-containing protein [Thermoleophilia bacterium]|nr:hemerythrin domain-containing protein [Thermoleophilia bacterium]